LTGNQDSNPSPTFPPNLSASPKKSPFAAVVIVVCFWQTTTTTFTTTSTTTRS